MNDNNTITFEQAKAIIDDEKDFIMLDVREEDEYSTGHAKEAVLFPLGTINAETVAKTIPSKDTSILVYCRSGRRSRMAAKKLQYLGYKKVYDIGSLAGWPYGLVW